MRTDRTRQEKPLRCLLGCAAVPLFAAAEECRTQWVLSGFKNSIFALRASAVATITENYQT